MNHKHEALWLLKKYMLYILCTLILYNPLHLTIGLSWILIQNELWIPKCCHAHFEVFSFLCLGFPKDVIKISTYSIPIIFVKHHFFKWKVVKSGSPIMCFHMNVYEACTPCYWEDLRLNNQNSNHDCYKNTLTIVIENKIVTLSTLKRTFIHPSKRPCNLDDDYDWEGFINKNEECLYEVFQSYD